jgi:hypothetical protein
VLRSITDVHKLSPPVVEVLSVAVSMQLIELANRVFEEHLVTDVEPPVVEVLSIAISAQLIDSRHATL